MPNRFVYGEKVKFLGYGDRDRYWNEERNDHSVEWVQYREDRKRMVGSIGTVSKIQTTTAGVGESPEDPFYIVSFDHLGLKDGFWTEELEAQV